jgi:hypothetical protein
MKKIFLLIICSLSLTSLFSQTPTWSDQVATIIYTNCSNCHRAGGIGPFPFMSYEDVVNNAYGISAQVSAHLMPPWKPDPSYVHFQDERILSESDINTLVGLGECRCAGRQPGRCTARTNLQLCLADDNDSIKRCSYLYGQ